jgi:hypothetical protein
MSQKRRRRSNNMATRVYNTQTTDTQLAKRLLATPTGCCTADAYKLFNKYSIPADTRQGPTDAELIEVLRQLAGVAADAPALRDDIETVTGMARLFLVLVTVLYTHADFPSDVVSRLWPVRIVAIDDKAAQTGAMNWAERQIAVGILEGAKAFAQSATTIDVIGTVDCIGDSLR